MKLRKQRKRTQAQLRYQKVWKWHFDKFVRKVTEACTPLSKALEQAYAKARHERQLQQE